MISKLHDPIFLKFEDNGNVLNLRNFTIISN